MQAFIRPRLTQYFKGGKTSSSSNRIAIERSHLTNGYAVFVRLDKGRHDFGFANHGSQGIAAANDLANSRQIRDDPIVFLRSTVGKPETRHHFVENQGNPVVRGHLTQPLEEAWHGR